MRDIALNIHKSHELYIKVHMQAFCPALTLYFFYKVRAG